MPHHVEVRLADGRDACADYREPIVKVMRRMLKAVADFRPVSPADDAQVSEWLDVNAERSAAHIAARYSCCPVDVPGASG